MAEAIVSKKIQGEVAQILDVDIQKLMRKRIGWMQAANNRNAFLDKLRKECRGGKLYSDAVVKYDQKHMRVF